MVDKGEFYRLARRLPFPVARLDGKAENGKGAEKLRPARVDWITSC
jgi:hypothetical protein